MYEVKAIDIWWKKNFYRAKTKDWEKKVYNAQFIFCVYLIHKTLKILYQFNISNDSIVSLIIGWGIFFTNQMTNKH